MRPVYIAGISFLGLGVVGFVIYSIMKKPSVKQPNPTSKTPVVVSDPKTQSLINSVLPGGSDASFSTQLNGMSTDAAQQFIFTAVTKGNNIPLDQAGNYMLYQYPNIQQAISAPTTTSTTPANNNLGTSAQKLSNFIKQGSDTVKTVEGIFKGSADGLRQGQVI